MQKGFSALIVLIGLVILAGLSYGTYSYFEQQKIKSIHSFEQCAKLYPVMESYPAQCNTPDGRHFVQSVTENERNSISLPKENLDVSYSREILEGYVTYKLNQILGFFK